MLTGYKTITKRFLLVEKISNKRVLEKFIFIYVLYLLKKLKNNKEKTD